jgi:hypothetical protein
VKLSFAFRIGSYLLALSGFFSIILTGNLPPLIVIPGLMAFGINLVQLLTGGNALFSKRTWYGMTLVVFILFVVDTLWISRSILHSTTHFLIFLMINKLFNLSTAKDYLQLYLISFLQLLAASGLSPGFSYAVSFLLFLILAVWTLILYHLQREVELQEKHRKTLSLDDQLAIPGQEHGLERVITLPFFTVTNIIAVSAFTLALLLFFLIPRIGTGMFHQGNTETVKVSGFSNSVRLGTIGPVKLDPTVVMRVVILKEGKNWKSPLYLRGTAFDFYDGLTWKKSLSPNFPLYKNDQDEFPITNYKNNAVTIHQEIISEPLDTPILFALSDVTAVRGPFSTLYTDSLGTLSLPFTPLSRYSYSATSKLPVKPGPKQIFSQNKIPSDIQKFYLQRPRTMDRIQTLAKNVTSGFQSPFQRATSIENFLKSNYRYSLDIPASTFNHPIEEFLFNRKTGYCEHYASAMVLMLRTLGIPARMVSGFLPTEWNDYGNYFTVRQRDAHTWVEAYLGGFGWVSFDPTPAVGLPVGFKAFSTLADYFDTLRLKWDRYIIQYSFRDQATMVKTLRDNAETFQKKTQDFFKDLLAGFRSLTFSSDQKGGFPYFLPFLGIIITAGALFLFYRLKKGKPQEQNPQEILKKKSKKVLPLYMNMLTLLQEHGFYKENHQTPYEFLRTMRLQESPLTQTATEITQLYISIRFGRLPFSSEEKFRISNLLAHLQKQGNRLKGERTGQKDSPKIIQE